jgi:hypothetical protein
MCSKKKFASEINTFHISYLESKNVSYLKKNICVKTKFWKSCPAV